MINKLLLEGASDLDLKELSTEIKVLIHLGRHPHIVNILGACTRGQGNRIYAILEYCKYGSLKTFLTKNKDRYNHEAGWETSGNSLEDEITLYNLMSICKQISNGIEFLHANKV